MEFHFSAKRIDPIRTKGGALAISAYMTARHQEWRIPLNNPHHWTDIAASGLVMPPGGAFTEPRDLWVAADQAERRKDGEYKMRGGHPPSVGTHADMSLPWGTTDLRAMRIAERISEFIAETHGVGVEWAVHYKNGRVDHIHQLWTSRKVTGTTLGEKARSLNKIAMTQANGNSKGLNPMEEIRAFASRVIKEETGVEWDHRSFKRRGITRPPELKINRAKYRQQRRELEKQGRGNELTEVETQLQQRRELVKKRKALQDDIKETKTLRIESWRKRQQEATITPIAQPAPAPAPKLQPKETDYSLLLDQRIRRMLEESEVEKKRRKEAAKAVPAPQQAPAPVKPVAPAQKSLAAAKPLTKAPAPTPKEIPKSVPTPKPSIIIKGKPEIHLPEITGLVIKGKEPAPEKPIARPVAPAPDAPRPAPAAAGPIKIEKAIDPIRDQNGRPRDPLFQQIAATIIHAYERENQELLDIAAALLSLCLSTTMEMAVRIAGRILKWSLSNSERPKGKPLDLQGCGQVAEHIMQKREAGISDDTWIWSWNGLPSGKSPARPKGRGGGMEF